MPVPGILTEAGVQPPGHSQVTALGPCAGKLTRIPRRCSGRFNCWPLISVAKPVAESTPSASRRWPANGSTRPSSAGRRCRLRGRRRSRAAQPGRQKPRAEKARSLGVSPASSMGSWTGSDPDWLMGRWRSCLHLVSTFREWGQLLLVVSSNPSDLLFCSPNGIRTRVFTLRGWSGPPPGSAAIRRSPGQGFVVPAGVRSNRWGPRGFSSNASSRPDAPDGGQNAGRHGERARANTRRPTAAAARSILSAWWSTPFHAVALANRAVDDVRRRRGPILGAARVLTKYDPDHERRGGVPGVIVGTDVPPGLGTSPMASRSGRSCRRHRSRVRGVDSAEGAGSAAAR